MTGSETDDHDNSPSIYNTFATNGQPSYKQQVANLTFQQQQQMLPQFMQAMGEMKGMISKIQADYQELKKISKTKLTNEEKKARVDKKHSKYCHTHGACAHTSQECNAPKEGHQRDATFANRKGGSTKFFKETGHNK